MSDVEEPEAKARTVVYLVRHGRTELNAAGVLRGRLDPPLDDVGRVEAAALGELFDDMRLTVVSSPFRRARQTAQPIADVTGAPLLDDELLVDRDYGSWAGRSTAAVVARFGSLGDAPGVEPAEAFAARVSTEISALADRWAPGPLAVVAHDAVNCYALAALVPGLANPERIAQRTGCWNRLLIGVGLYGLGNFSATLLILRATQLLHDYGRSDTAAAAVAVLLYAAHNAANAAVAYPAGAAADRLGRRPVLVAGVALFGVACAAFAFGSANVAVLGVLFVAVGASTALVETGQGAHAAELLDPAIRGRGFGLLGLVDGIGDLVSSVVVGVLFTVTSPAWGFGYAAALAAAATVVLVGERAGASA